MLLSALFSIGHPVKALTEWRPQEKDGLFWVFLESGVFTFSAY